MSTIIFPYEADVPLHFPGDVDTGDLFGTGLMPYDGEILGYYGSVAALGAGAGTKTSVQVRNATRSLDYFATLPSWNVDSATKVLQDGSLIDSPTFLAGDFLEAEIMEDATTPARDAILILHCKFFRPITV